MQNLDKTGIKRILIIFRNYRYTAYKQFTWWIHSRLGKGVRRVIPSFVVWCIRGEYPSVDNCYVEFQHAQNEKT